MIHRDVVTISIPKTQTISTHRAVVLDPVRGLPFLYPAGSLGWHREAKMGPSKPLPPHEC